MCKDDWPSARLRTRDERHGRAESAGLKDNHRSLPSAKGYIGAVCLFSDVVEDEGGYGISPVKTLLQSEIKPITRKKMYAPRRVMQDNVEADFTGFRRAPQEEERILGVGPDTGAVPNSSIHAREGASPGIIAAHHCEVAHGMRAVPVAVEDNEHTSVRMKEW